MDFDDQAICPSGDTRPRHGVNIFPMTGAVAGVQDDRQVGLGFQDGDGVDISGIAGGSFEGADAALTQDHPPVTVGKDVFGSHE